MSKNFWIILVSVVIVLITVAFVAILIFIPSPVSTTVKESYTTINASDYGYQNFEQDKESLKDLKEQYEVTFGDITQAERFEQYVPGNVNPFTPKTDINPYNEPSYTGNGESETQTPNGSTSNYNTTK